MSRVGSAGPEDEKEDGEGAIQDAINAQEEIKDMTNVNSQENLIKPESSLNSLMKSGASFAHSRQERERP